MILTNTHRQCVNRGDKGFLMQLLTFGREGSTVISSLRSDQYPIFNKKAYVQYTLLEISYHPGQTFLDGIHTPKEEEKLKLAELAKRW
jgi:hypothetical protein